MKKFITLYGTPIVNIIEYIKDYLSTHDNIELLIGCDSQERKKGKRTTYGVVIALYTPGKGAHVLCYKESTPVERNLAVRLINETWRSIEIAEYLRENGLPKVKYIDIDLNPDPKYDSNKTLRQAIGLVEGMGYTARWKRHGAMVTRAADHLVRDKKVV